MGGANIFVGDNDANVIHNSALINLNTARVLKKNVKKVFYSSSACMYPAYNQTDPDNQCVQKIVLNLIANMAGKNF